ncbi:MAG: AraC family transcriptional regulator [Eubacteriales bacterium]|nr:AraC family transcriptional regulator [Eubacteriales bacterium]
MGTRTIRSEAVNEAIEYILTHVSESITLEQTAEYCHLSKFYFSRLFKEETGESVCAFIKRFKLEQSAIKLKAENHRQITDIGLDYGYSASNYSSAFKAHYDTSPILFRRKIRERTKFRQSLFDEIDGQITFQVLPDVLVAYDRAIGSYAGMKADWCSFIEKYSPYINSDTVFFDRTFEDPGFTDENRCVYDLCMSIEEKDRARYENTCVLRGGRFAVYPFRGKMPEIYPLHQALIGTWFAHSGYELDERYAYSRYRLVAADCRYMEFDVCIPVKQSKHTEV